MANEKGADELLVVDGLLIEKIDGAEVAELSVEAGIITLLVKLAKPIGLLASLVTVGLGMTASTFVIGVDVGNMFLIEANGLGLEVVTPNAGLISPGLPKLTFGDPNENEGFGASTFVSVFAGASALIVGFTCAAVCCSFFSGNLNVKVVTFSFLLVSFSGSAGLGIVVGIIAAGFSLEELTLLDNGIENVAETATFVLLIVVDGFC